MAAKQSIVLCYAAWLVSSLLLGPLMCMGLGLGGGLDSRLQTVFEVWEGRWELRQPPGLLWAPLIFLPICLGLCADVCVSSIDLGEEAEILSKPPC